MTKKEIAERRRQINAEINQLLVLTFEVDQWFDRKHGKAGCCGVCGRQREDAELQVVETGLGRVELWICMDCAPFSIGGVLDEHEENFYNPKNGRPIPVKFLDKEKENEQG